MRGTSKMATGKQATFVSVRKLLLDFLPPIAAQSLLTAFCQVSPNFRSERPITKPWQREAGKEDYTSEVLTRFIFKPEAQPQ